MSGFCNSSGTLRGPGSVPPRPGRIGCGVPPGAVGVCALAAATVAIPTAAVLSTVRRERLMTLFSLCNEKHKTSAGAGALRRTRAPSEDKCSRTSGQLSAPPSPVRSHSLDELAANFPAGVSGRVDVDVPAPGEQVGGLGVGQIGRIFERARARRNRHGDAGVLAGFRRPVEMGHRGRAGQPGIIALPGELLARGVVGRSHRARGFAVIRRTSSLALRSALNETVSANTGHANITHAASATPGKPGRKTIRPIIESSLVFPKRDRPLTFLLLQHASPSPVDRSRFGCEPRKPRRKTPAHRPWRRFSPYTPRAPPDLPSGHGHVPACARTDAHSWRELAVPPAR